MLFILVRAPLEKGAEFAFSRSPAYKSAIRLKTVPTNGFIRLSNIHRFVCAVI